MNVLYKKNKEISEKLHTCQTVFGYGINLLKIDVFTSTPN